MDQRSLALGFARACWTLLRSVAAAVGALGLLGGVGCEGASEPLRFELRVGALEGRVRAINLSIIEGGCVPGAPVLHADEFRVDEAPAAMPRLAAGVYGFRVQAQGAACQVLGLQCTQVTLPLAPGAVLVLSVPDAPGLEACAECHDGLCDRPAEAATDTGPIGPIVIIEPEGETPPEPPTDIDLGLEPSLVDRACLAAASAPLELSAVDSPFRFDTGNGSWSAARTGFSGPAGTLIPSTGPGSALRVLCTTSFRIAPGATLEVVGPHAFGIAAVSDVDIEGTLNASANLAGAFAPGPGGFAGASAQLRDNFAARQGSGPCGGAFPSGISFGDDIGGGGAGHGGRGGEGSAIQEAAGGPGGAPCGSETFAYVLGGSGGAAGGGTNEPGRGGGGGGAVYLYAGASVTVTAGGAVHVNGAAGQSGAAGDGAGGGGAGGMVLIEAPSVLLSGILTANGGGGGAGSYRDANDAFQRGAAAEHGRNDAVRAQGGAGQGEGASGGRGGAGSTLDGDNAQDATAPSLNNGGGGGGAAGRIGVRSPSAQTPGTLSPAATAL